MRFLLKIFLFLVTLSILVAVPASAKITDPTWSRLAPDGSNIISLHFFWSKTCPHCRKAKPFINELAQSYDWLELNLYEISENRKNAEYFMQLSETLGNDRFAVPAFMFCDRIIVGYFDDQTTGEKLRRQLLDCNESFDKNLIDSQIKNTKQEDIKISVPLMGELDAEKYSLPVFTIIIAGLDAFNPCAFFVLLLLLSMLVHVKDRRRMLLIGGIFVFFSGFIYFLFMAAWLNLFLYLGELRVITVIAALIAIVVSVINIKDFFYFKKGVSLSIPESAKPGLYGRIRSLTRSTSLPTMIAGTIMLAIVANLYELLCTSGFPMVFTRILTLNELPSSTHYLYMIFYNIIYVIPLTVIVLVFTVTLGSRKLSEKEGRILKLISGMMMLGLGILLLLAPDLLSDLMVAIALIFGSLILSFLVVYFEKRFKNAGSH